MRDQKPRSNTVIRNTDVMVISATQRSCGQ